MQARCLRMPISEDHFHHSARAYLLEINTLTESIRRVVKAGSSATDLAVHKGAPDLTFELVSALCWLIDLTRSTGSFVRLLALRRIGPARTTSYAFQPAVRAGSYGRRRPVDRHQHFDTVRRHKTSRARLCGKGGGIRRQAKLTYLSRRQQQFRRGDSTSSMCSVNTFRELRACSRRESNYTARERLSSLKMAPAFMEWSEVRCRSRRAMTIRRRDFPNVNLDGSLRLFHSRREL